MSALVLHDFHQSRGATFGSVGGGEVVSRYGSADSEYQALSKKAALLDLSFRSRLCVLGADREKFLHGQVTNDVLRLKTGQGCYAALVSGKGKIESDLFVHKLREELLLDFEPGQAGRVADRLNKFIIAEDVQVADVAPHYGLLAVCGPSSAEVLAKAWPQLSVPADLLHASVDALPEGDLYLINNPRYGLPGFDLFVPDQALQRVAGELESAGRALGLVWAGFDATEVVRVENGVPRFGIDMTEATLPQEAEIQDRAVSFAKGCYIGQEIIARIRTYGQVAKALRLIKLRERIGGGLPQPGAKVFVKGKEVGFTCSAVYSPRHSGVIAFAYIRKEVNVLGTVLEVESGEMVPGQIIAIPGKGPN